MDASRESRLHDPSQPKVRLCLWIEPAPDAPLHGLDAALDAIPFAAVIVGVAPGNSALTEEAAAPVVACAQKRGVAVLIAGDAPLALAVGADGVHVPAGADVSQRYAVARAALGAGRIAGADAGPSRDAAMTLAENGADYVSFGLAPAATDAAARDSVLDLVAWWAELFEVPVVAYASTPADAAELAAAGADFIAVALSLDWTAADARRTISAFGHAAANGLRES